MRASGVSSSSALVIALVVFAASSCTAFNAGPSSSNNNTGDSSVPITPENNDGGSDANSDDDARADAACTKDDFATSFEAANYAEGWDDTFKYPVGDGKITLGPSTAERHSGVTSFEAKVTGDNKTRGYALLHNLKSPGTPCVDFSFWLHLTTPPSAFMLVGSIEFDTNPHTSLQVALDGNDIAIQEQSLTAAGQLLKQNPLSAKTIFIADNTWTRIRLRYEQATASVLFAVNDVESTVKYTLGHDKAARVALGVGYADPATSGVIHIDDVALK